MSRTPRSVGPSKYAFTGTLIPWRTSRNWSTATSQPNVPRWSVRAPKSGRPSGPSALRVRAFASPVTGSPSRRWKARTAATVPGPEIASIGPR